MKLTTVRAYPKTRDAISKQSKKMGKLGSQQEVLEKWRKIVVTCECNK